MALPGGGNTLGEAVLLVSTDQTALDKELDVALAKSKAFGQKLSGIGKDLSLYLTAPIIGLATIAVSNFNESAQALAQVEAGIKSTGGAADRTSEQLERMAAGLQTKTLFDDDEILGKVTANLLTFTQVSGQVFDEAQVQILNLSQRLGQDLQSSAIQVGKALNSPVDGLTALGRVGVKFTEDQKNLIKGFVESGRVVEAQKIILKELAVEFGGAAEAAAKVGAGPLIQVKNQIGDLSEEFGKIILESIQPLIPLLQSAVKWFADMSPEMKTAAVAVAGVAAAIGPLLVVVGSVISALSTISATIVGAGGLIGILSAVGAALTGPVGLTLAVAAVVTAITAWVADTEEGGKAIDEVFTGLSELWQEFREIADEALTDVAFFWREHGDEIKAVVGAIIRTVKGTLTAAFKILADIVTAGLKVITGAVQLFHGYMNGDWEKMSKGIQNIWKGMWDAIIAILRAPVDLVKGAVSGMTNEVTGYFAKMYDAVVGHSWVPDMIDRIEEEFGRLGLIMVGPTQSAVSKVMGSFSSLSGIKGTLGFLSDVNSAIGGGVAGIGNMIGSFVGLPGIGTAVSGVIGLGQKIAGLFGKGRKQADIVTGALNEGGVANFLNSITQGGITEGLSYNELESLQRQLNDTRGIWQREIMGKVTDERVRPTAEWINSGIGTNDVYGNTSFANAQRILDAAIALAQRPVVVQIDGREVARSLDNNILYGGSRLTATGVL
jgi:hypothetical protein